MGEIVLPKIIGLVGPIRAGKSTVASFFQGKYGYQIASNSKVLERILLNLELTVTRKNLQRLGDSIFDELGNAAIAKSLTDKIGEREIVVDGIRYLEEIEHYRQYKDFLLIGVKADDDVRYERALNEIGSGKDEPMSVESFKRLSRARSEVEVPELLRRADVVIENSESLVNLHYQLENILKSFTSDRVC